MADYDVNSLLGISTEPIKEPKKADRPTAKKESRPKGKQSTPAKGKDGTRKSRKSAGSFTVPKRELYDRRVDLLLKPSTYNKLKALADENRTTVNALANAIFEDYLG